MTQSFQPATSYAAGSNPYSVAVADVNGDGKPDLVVANLGSNTVSVLPGNGSGGFGAATSYAAGSGPTSVAIADVNGDGKPDLVVADFNGNTVSVLPGNSSGGFGAATSYAAGSSPYFVTVADVNGDGKPDLVVADDGGGVDVLPGNGSGGFGAATSYAAGPGPTSVAVADVNGDGKPDLVVADNNGDTVSVLPGNGSGTFGAATSYAAGSAPVSVAVADVNGDGKPDLVVADFNGSTVSVLPGNGSGTFGAATSYAAGSSPYSVAVADVNGDGKPDLVVADLNGGTVSVLPGNGSGTFGAATSYAAGSAPISVAVADVNGDGKPDLVVAGLGGGVDVLPSSSAATITVTSVAAVPSAAGPLDAGRSVTFTLAISQAVTVAGSPVLTLDDGGTATYDAAASNPTSLVFDYTVAAGQNTPDLTVSGLTLNGASVSVPATPLFQTATSYAAGSNPASVAVADVNGDGKPDLVVANNGDNTVDVLPGNGSGGFGAATSYAAGASPYSVAVADVNGDGKPDLVVANNGDNTVDVLPGNGSGGFGAATSYAVGSHPASVAVADVNGDGKPDLVVADFVDNTVDVLPGNGSGGFGTATSYAVGSHPASVAVADVNGDGKPDLVVADFVDNTVDVLLGNGSGGFGAATSYAVGSYPYSVAVADVNGDGKPDLVVADYGDNTVDVLPGNGSGGFGTATSYAAGSYPTHVAVADVNGDGKPDLVVADGYGGVDVLPGNGSGGFSAATSYAAGSGPTSVAVADVNGDGKPDLVVTDNGGGVDVLPGNGAQASGTFAPASAATATGASTSLVVDTTPPVVSAITAAPATGDLDAGHTITFALAASEPVTVTGTPVLTLNDGGSATYAGGSGSNVLTFTTTVAAGQNAATLAATGVSLPGGAAIQDLAGNPANLSGASITFAGLQVDTTPPTVTVVTAAPSVAGPLDAGRTISFVVAASEAVTVSTAGGTPALVLNDGGSATYTGQSGGNLLFTTTVAAGQNAADLKVTGLALNGGTLADLAGNPLDASALPTLTGSNTGLVVDTTPPTLTAVTATPSVAGPLDAGRTVSFAVTPSEAVSVSTAGGTPTLTLNDGGSATYTGQASGTLVFTTTVAAGQNTADLKVTGLDLGGSSISDLAGNLLNDAGLAGLSGSNTGLVVDTTAPTLTAVTATPSVAGPLDTGRTVSFAVTPSEAVAVSTAGGTPTLTLNDGGSATYTGQASGTLLFTTTVAAGQNAADLKVTGLALNGGTLADLAGNPLDASALPTLTGSNTGLAIDTTAPTLTAVTATPSVAGPLDTGRTVSFAVTPSEAVAVSTTHGTPVLTLNDGGSATYSSGSGSSTLTFTTTVATGQNTADLTITGLALNGGTLSDTAGNTLDASALPTLAGSNTGLVVDTTPPVVTTITAASATGDLDAGQTISFTLATSEAVTVTGTPVLALNDGSSATYSAGSGSNALTFTTTVAAGQNTADLKVTGLALGGGTITDLAGNLLNDAGLAGLSGSNTGLVIDTTPPTLAVLTVSANAGPLGAGNLIGFVLRPSERVTVSTTGGTPALTLSNGATAAYSAQYTNGDLVFIATVAPGQDTSDLKVTGLALNGGTVSDLAGNALDASGLPTLAGIDTGLVIDTTAPTLTALTATPSTTGPLDAGRTVSFAVTPSEAVTVSTRHGTPALDLNDGGSATYTGQSGGTLVFTTTVTTGQNTADLKVTGLALNGGKITDLADNALNASALPTLAGSDTHLVIDTTEPTLTALAATPSTTGPLDAGRTVSFTLTPSEAVTVSTTGGTPVLTLNEGSATYTGQVGGNLVFAATVAAGQNTADLKVTGLDLEGGIISDLAGNPLNDAGLPTLAGSNTGLVIDTMPPVVTTITATPSTMGPLDAGRTVSFVVMPSERVTVSTTHGTPTLVLNDGGTATYSAGSGSSALTFTTTVAAGQNTADLKVTGLALGGGTITDLAGNALDASALPTLAGSNTGLVIDTTAPTLTAITATPSVAGPLDAGRTVSFALTPSEAVTVSTTHGTPTLVLNDGGTATYTGQDNSGRLLFTATVAAGQNTANLKVIGLALGGGTITDTAGNSLNATGLAGLSGSNTGLVIDTTAPTVTALVATPDAAGPLDAGHTIGFALAPSEALTIHTSGGTPTLALSDGGTATYTAQDSDGTLLFTTTVAAGQDTADLKVTGLALNGAVATDAAGNPLDTRGVTRLPGSNTGLVIDTTPPTVTVSLANDTGASATDRITADPALSGTADPNALVTVTEGSAVVGTATAAADGTWQLTPTGLADGDHAFTASETDAAGNVGTATVAITLETVAAPPGSLGMFVTGSIGPLRPGNAVTNTSTPTIFGTGAAGDTILLTTSSQADGTAIVTADGTWQATLAAPLAGGANTISTTSRDLAGNVSAPTTLQVTVMPAADANGVTASAMSSTELAGAGQLQLTSNTNEVTLTDGTLSVSPATNIAFVARLYEGALGRAPDALGLSGWNAQLASGTSQAAVASSLLNSPEFAASKQANGSDTQFVTNLYQNELGRVPDQPGLANALSGLQSGTVSRADMLASIAASPEAEQHWAGLTSALWAPDPTASLVRSVYEAGLGRDAEGAGLKQWTSLLAGGLTAQDFARDVAGTPEFQALHSGQTDQQFVTGLYQSGLGRAPDAAGLSTWVSGLQSGMTRADVLLGIAASPEGLAHVPQAL